MKKTTLACWLFAFFFLAAMHLHGGEVVVTADNNIKEVGLESSKRADEGKTREVIVKLQSGFVLEEPPSVGSDPGSAWMWKTGGKGDTSATFVGLQVKEAVSPKVYAPVFYGEAVRKKSKGSGGKGGGEKPVDEFDWRVTGKYTVSECTFEAGWVDYTVEFKGPNYDHTKDKLNENTYCAVTIDTNSTYNQAMDAISAVMSKKEAEIGPTSNPNTMAFFDGRLTADYDSGGDNVVFPDTKERCVKCGGVLIVMEIYPRFEVSKDISNVYCPKWEGQPKTLNVTQKRISDLFQRLKKHEETHQGYHMVYRNLVLWHGKKEAQRFFRTKVCLPKHDRKNFMSTFWAEFEDRQKLFNRFRDQLYLERKIKDAKHDLDDPEYRDR